MCLFRQIDCQAGNVIRANGLPFLAAVVAVITLLTARAPL